MKFSSDPAKVLERSLAFMRGVRQSRVPACSKHFPGDGPEERDQHLLKGVNHLLGGRVGRFLGQVYRGLIEAGIHSFMIGHIALPAYTRRLRPGIRDEEIMPATISPELLQDLLRGQPSASTD